MSRWLVLHTNSCLCRFSFFFSFMLTLLAPAVMLPPESKARSAFPGDDDRSKACSFRKETTWYDVNARTITPAEKGVGR